MKLRIGADTTIGALLEAYPQAEAVLINMAPAFAKLRNPIIRRTVAKIATIEQAAKIGQVNLREMIERLCECAGQSVGGEVGGSGDTAVEGSWLLGAAVGRELNADEILAAGGHPIGKLREAVESVESGKAVVLHSSFRPEPLIVTMQRAGVEVYCTGEGSDFVTYFGRRGPQG
ncbi:MAG: DUF1858 domain-containing protein [Bryobacterales bacterium]|nr:DUF1858 domain-containing protein [Bryobacterales bacterium]